MPLYRRKKEILLAPNCFRVLESGNKNMSSGMLAEIPPKYEFPRTNKARPSMTSLECVFVAAIFQDLSSWNYGFSSQVWARVV